MVIWSESGRIWALFSSKNCSTPFLNDQGLYLQVQEADISPKLKEDQFWHVRGPTWPKSGDPGPLWDRFDPWFESIKKVSNQAEIWCEHSSSCVEASVKISQHLNLQIPRYDRFKVAFLVVVLCSNRSTSNRFVRIDLPVCEDGDVVCFLRIDPVSIPD